MVKVGMIGLGKMGMSHFSIVRAHADVDVVGICDSSGYVLDVMSKYTGVTAYKDFEEMITAGEVEAVVISTPTRLHAPMVRRCLELGVHVFCEKPFCLDPRDSRELATHAEERDLVTQVGYHNRFVGAFQEVKRLLELGAIGRPTQVLAEAYGPVVLKPQGSTWRTKKLEGGGALYDYAAHPLDLLTWFFGRPTRVAGNVLEPVFSTETEDQVMSTLSWSTGVQGQLSVNWSDESQRKMTTKVTIWGTGGRIYADRQEIQVYLRADSDVPEGYHEGWNVRYTTELTEPVDFYLRGEEYSAQIDAWVRRIVSGELHGVNEFRDAAVTDEALAAIVHGAGPDVVVLDESPGGVDTRKSPRRRWRRRSKLKRKV